MGDMANKMKNKISKKLIAVLSISFLLIAQLAGCGAVSKEPLTGVTKVVYMITIAEPHEVMAYILTDDLQVKGYEIQPYSDNKIDVFSGEIPPDEYLEEEYSISQDAWDKLMEDLGQNDFMSMPEELPDVKTCDGATMEIQVETASGTHKTGGYKAGNGEGKEYPRQADDTVPAGDHQGYHRR